MPLPWMHFRPASITDHFEESIMIGTRAMSGSEAIRFRKRDHRRFRIEHALVHVDVDDLRAARDLLARDVERGVVVVRLDQAAELRRAGDVGALADVDEQAVRADVQRLEAGQAGSARSSTGGLRGGNACDRLADVPDVIGRRAAAAADDVDEAAGREVARSARPSRTAASSYSPNAFGRPAFG